MYLFSPATAFTLLGQVPYRQRRKLQDVRVGSKNGSRGPAAGCPGERTSDLRYSLAAHPGKIADVGLFFGFGISGIRGGPLVSQAVLSYRLNMKRSIKKATPKRRGRPATGKDPTRTFRLSDQFIANVDAWAASQDDQPGRSEAIRRLVELGLKAKAK